jgi:twinkle protein
MEYARKRHGIDVFIIDSLFKCGLDPSDFGAQREFADQLTTFVNNSGAHVILVAHSRKTQNGNEHGVPSKSDVSGSSDLTNAAFNVIIWWRNKLKKLKLDEARQNPIPDLEAINHWLEQPDGCGVLDKQRFGEGEEAKVHVWFNAESFQFHTAIRRKFPYFTLR